jgi:hypothetical protein
VLIDRLLGIKDDLLFYVIAFLPYDEQVRLVRVLGGHGKHGRAFLTAFYKNNQRIYMVSLPRPDRPLPPSRPLVCVSHDHPVPLHDRGKHVISYLDIRYPCESITRLPKYLLDSILNMRMRFCTTAAVILRETQPRHIMLDYDALSVRDASGLSNFVSVIGPLSHIVTQMDPARPSALFNSFTTSTCFPRSLAGYLYGVYSQGELASKLDVVLEYPEHFPIHFSGALRVAIGFVYPLTRETRVVYYKCNSLACTGLGKVHLHNVAKSTKCGPCHAKEHTHVTQWQCTKTHAERGMGCPILCNVCEKMRDYLRSVDGKPHCLSYDTLIQWVDSRAEFKRNLGKNSIRVRRDQMPSTMF